jgi:hypothetical protein
VVRAGGWYFFVVLLSFGILTPIPFAHAATRLKSPVHWLWPVLYTAAVVGILATGNNGGFIIGMIVIALVHLIWLRRQVWPRGAVATAPPAAPAFPPPQTQRSPRRSQPGSDEPKPAGSWLTTRCWRAS